MRDLVIAQLGNSGGITFFLPLMFIVVIELSRIARDMELTKIVKEGHRPLVIGSIIDIPFAILEQIIKFAIGFVEIEIQGITQMMRQPGNIINIIIKSQLRILELLAGTEVPESVREDLQGSNLVILDQYQERLDATEDIFLSRLGSAQDRAVQKLGSIQDTFLPPLGRFAFLHTTSYVIMAYLFVLAYENLVGDLRNISLTLVGLLWFLLPILEVDEYDSILGSRHSIDSLSIHFLGSFSAMFWLYLSLIEGLNTPLRNEPFVLLSISIPIDWLTNGIFFIAFSLLLLWAFLRSLYLELDDVSLENTGYFMIQ